MAGLEYVWRLDDDSLLTRPVDYDLFAYMRRHRLKYGYVLTVSDWCTFGLWPAADEYLTLRNGSVQSADFRRAADVDEAWSTSSTGSVKTAGFPPDVTLSKAAVVISPSLYNSWPRDMIFYNNFEISSMSLWTSPGYRDYIGFIDRLGGIYRFRWGDAPIKTIAVTLFVPENETHQFKDIGYKHQTFQNP